MEIRPRAGCRFDLVALGEVMLRLDPGEGRIATARAFQAWEGGGEYNVARGPEALLRPRTAVVTALVDNPVGRLVAGPDLPGRCRPVLMSAGSRTTAWAAGAQRAQFHRARLRRARPPSAAPTAGTPRSRSCGPERSTGTRSSAVRAPAGSTPAASSPRSPRRRPCVAREAMEAARRHGTVVSYDLNYRPSLWKCIGGAEARPRGQPRAGPAAWT